MPHFTAAISTYNREALLVQALDSVLAQTYADFEVIVVDNGSLPATRTALEPYMDRIRYVWQENRGRAGGRNRAIELAHGTYVAFLDDDDLWLADKLERQEAAFREHPRAALVHGHVEVIDEAGALQPQLTAVHRGLWSRAHAGRIGYAEYALESRCFTSATAIPLAALKAIGGYDGSVRLEDVDLYLRLALQGEIVFLEGDPLARYRHHASQTGNDELARGMIDVAHKHLALLETGEDVPDRARARRNLLLSLAWSHHVLLHRRESRRYTLRAVRLDPLLPFRQPRLIRHVLVSLLPSRLVARLRRRRTV
jgi:glycosyltransferase involved in cell wall biosynthesis